MTSLSLLGAWTEARVTVGAGASTHKRVERRRQFIDTPESQMSMVANAAVAGLSVASPSFSNLGCTCTGSMRMGGWSLLARADRRPGATGDRPMTLFTLYAWWVWWARRSKPMPSHAPYNILSRPNNNTPTPHFWLRAGRGSRVIDVLVLVLVPPPGASLLVRTAHRNPPFLPPHEQRNVESPPC